MHKLDQATRSAKRTNMNSRGRQPTVGRTMECSALPGPHSDAQRRAVRSTHGYSPLSALRTNRSRFAAILISAFCLLPSAFLSSGCVFCSYRRVPIRDTSGLPASWQSTGAEAVHFRCWSLFADEKLTQVAIDRAMKNGSHIGLAIGAAEEKVDSEALDNLTSAVIAGVIKGLK